MNKKGIFVQKKHNKQYIFYYSILQFSRKMFKRIFVFKKFIDENIKFFLRIKSDLKTKFLFESKIIIQYLKEI